MVFFGSNIVKKLKNEDFWIYSVELKYLKFYKKYLEFNKNGKTVGLKNK